MKMQPALLDPPASLRESGVPLTLGGADPFVAAWVARQLEAEDGFGPCAAIGVVLDGSLIAGVVYHDYRKMARGATMQASIATTTPRWATRRTLRDIFSYPFVQMQVARLWVCVGRKNRRSRSMVERLGFKMEGVARRAHDGAMDAMIYSMLPFECRWIR